VVNKAQDLAATYLKEGTLIGYVLDKDQLRVRTVVLQDDIDLVRKHLQAIDLRFSESLMQQHSAQSLLALPSAVQELPSPALSLANGGLIATNPTDNQGLKTLERVFLWDVKPTHAPLPTAVGERVHVRFNHGYEPLAWQVWRRLRQLFLSHFHV
jgi:putative peptide zinc metalloprotease protein